MGEARQRKQIMPTNQFIVSQCINTEETSFTQNGSPEKQTHLEF